MSSVKILLAFMLTAMAATAVVNSDNYEVKVIQINSRWNRSNSIDLSQLQRCEKLNSYLEDQPFSVQRRLPNVPVILVYKGKETLAMFGGNIMLEPTVSLDSLQSIVNSAYD